MEAKDMIPGSIYYFYYIGTNTNWIGKLWKIEYNKIYLNSYLKIDSIGNTTETKKNDNYIHWGDISDVSELSIATEEQKQRIFNEIGIKEDIFEPEFSIF